MTKIFKNQKLQVLIFGFLIFIISFLTFWRAFNFDFWGEDWEQIWYAIYQPSMINNQNEMQHPIVIYEELFLAKMFEFNAFYWQTAGFLLKILSAFAVSVMMLGLTKSKKAAFFTGLIYASSVGGLASVTWVAAHASVLIIPFLCFGIYFWVIKGRYALALLFLIISFAGDPSRGVFGSFFVILWEILSLMQDPKRLKEFKRRIIVLLISLLVIFSIFQLAFHYENTVSVGYNLGIVFNHPIRSLDDFLTNIGNLLIGWIIPISQNIFSVSTDNFFGKITGYLSLFLTIFWFIRFLRKKSESLKTLLIFLVWIPIFFFPNWLLPNQEMIQNGQVLGVTHRYFTLSAIGLVCLLGYVISKIKNNLFKSFLLLFVILSNIFMSNQILEMESYYRSSNVTRPMWDKIEKDVPNDEENSLFFIQGDDKFRVNDISQAKIPFAIRRGIKSRDKWPASSGDPGVIKRYLCGKNEEGRIIPIFHLHAWYIRGNTLENISEKVQREFSEIDCDFQ